MITLSPTRISIDGILLADGSTGLMFRVDSGPPSPPRQLGVALNAPPLNAFLSTPANLIQPPLLEQAGQALFMEVLLNQNFQVSLTNTRTAPMPDMRCVVVHATEFATIAHNYPWEVLHDGTGFIADNPGVAFTRTVKPAAPRPSSTFDGEFRVASVIAADGVPGGPEWDALSDAIGCFHQPYRCRVFVADPQLKAVIESQNRLNVEVFMVPATENELLIGFNAFAPHLCHIFCHGGPLGIEIANAAVAWGGRPLTLTGRGLAPYLRSTWLTCLNACQSASATMSSTSVGCELVSEGVPFVSCMREDMPVNAAHQFTRAFLSQALAELSGKLAPGQQPFALNFNAAMQAARTTLAHTAAGAAGFGQSKAWTLPILCTWGGQDGPARFEVLRAGAGPGGVDLVARLQQIATLKAALRQGIVPEDKLAIVQQEIDRLTDMLG